MLRPEELDRGERDDLGLFAQAHADVPDLSAIRIQSWEDDNATMIAAVKKETGEGKVSMAPAIRSLVRR